MNRLDRLESQSIYILREAVATIDNVAMLWSLGKDSNTMIRIAQKAFFGRIPFPLLHVDTGKKFPEMYAFREEYAEKWNINLLRQECPDISETDEDLPPAARSAARKSLGLKAALATHGFRGLIVGIRRDEEATRAKERVFSPRGSFGEWQPREQPPEFWNQYATDPPPGAHIRVHPLLHWTELDIWAYIQREDIPVVSLYFARGGKRYRSLGDMDITRPIDSTAATIEEILKELAQTRQAERAGRLMDHESEDAFERLRVDGYM